MAVGGVLKHLFLARIDLALVLEQARCARRNVLLNCLGQQLKLVLRDSADAFLRLAFKAPAARLVRWEDRDLLFSAILEHMFIVKLRLVVEVLIYDLRLFDLSDAVASAALRGFTRLIPQHWLTDRLEPLVYRQHVRVIV